MANALVSRQDVLDDERLVPLAPEPPDVFLHDRVFAPPCRGGDPDIYRDLDGDLVYLLLADAPGKAAVNRRGTVRGSGSRIETRVERLDLRLQECRLVDKTKPFDLVPQVGESRLG